MSAYYNEHDPYAAQWLRNLITAGHIAPGDVDERSIEDVSPADLAGYRQCHFFAGIGVWSYALRLAGWPDDRPVWTGSCPCQPFSAAGKGAGITDSRHLWPAFHWLIRECRPDVIFGEQVASKDGLAWLDIVQADLEATSYANGALDICAAGVGAAHIRQRLFFVAERLADTNQDGCNQRRQREPAPGDDGIIGNSGMVEGQPDSGPTNGFWRATDWLYCRDGKWRAVESGTFPLVNGAPSRVGRLRAYGNAINAQAAAEFIAAYAETFNNAATRQEAKHETG